MRSPLGQHAEVVAAFVAVATVAAAITSRFLNFVDPFLDSLAALSIGAIFGSTATANGVKAGHAEVVAKLDTAAAIAAGAATAAAATDTMAVDQRRSADAAERTADNTDPNTGAGGYSS